VSEREEAKSDEGEKLREQQLLFILKRNKNRAGTDTV